MNNNFQDNAIPNNSATADSEPVLCVECCEFFGNSLYSNLCSGCFKNKQKVKEIPQPEPINNENADPNEYRIDPKDFIAGLQFLSDNITAMTEKEKKEKSPVKQADSSQCHTCPRKAGALAFQCKCGHKFCKIHRLPEEHDCTYDFATAEKEKLKVANPVVKGSKMERF